ncbi:family 1 glycosylhydrolase [Sphingomonas sp. GCM10030256]|uniref:family 1 glycosylhydrolase n=1 Tax=Sphingomonas sp. GCM10030256 TaxID=3273427 RepID=UPI003624642E
MINPYFMFATGIEGSCPTIAGGRTRIDQFERCGHYRLWSTDFDLVQELGISFLRYGPPLHRTLLGASRYDWSFADLTFGDLKRRDIAPIADLCHFGVPDWIGDFQNPDFPDLFAAYARAFAERFPWVQLYTPVNEMFVCALFSARFGWWNEQLRTDRAFVTALKHVVKANILASNAILEVRPDAIFIQSESSEHFHPSDAHAIDAADALNVRRFLSLDLNYGQPVDAGTYEYLLDNGMTREEHAFFRSRMLRHHCVLGVDYYATNEHRVDASGASSEAGEVIGYDQIAQQYFSRFGLPLMHTETNRQEGPVGDEAVQWLWRQWSSLRQVRENGIPTLGFTWYSLTDQVDWDTALREDNGRVNSVGLFDLDRNIRAVGTAYKALIAEWHYVLPARSVCLAAPIIMPSEYDEPFARRRREWMRHYHAEKGVLRQA